MFRGDRRKSARRQWKLPEQVVRVNEATEVQQFFKNIGVKYKPGFIDKLAGLVIAPVTRVDNSSKPCYGIFLSKSLRLKEKMTVCDYTGREVALSERNKNTNHYLLKKYTDDKEACIDAEFEGGPGRFLNHSPCANCEFDTSASDGRIRIKLKPGSYPAHTQLLVDYGDAYPTQGHVPLHPNDTWMSIADTVSRYSYTVWDKIPENYKQIDDVASITHVPPTFNFEVYQLRDDKFCNLPMYFSRSTPPFSKDLKFSPYNSQPYITALMHFASTGQIKKVNALLSNSYCVVTQDSRGHTALHYACRSLSIDMKNQGQIITALLNKFPEMLRVPDRDKCLIFKHLLKESARNSAGKRKRRRNSSKRETHVLVATASLLPHANAVLEFLFTDKGQVQLKKIIEESEDLVALFKCFILSDKLLRTVDQAKLNKVFSILITAPTVVGNDFSTQEQQSLNKVVRLFGQYTPLAAMATSSDEKQKVQRQDCKRKKKSKSKKIKKNENHVVSKLHGAKNPKYFHTLGSYANTRKWKKTPLKDEKTGALKKTKNPISEILPQPDLLLLPPHWPRVHYSQPTLKTSELSTRTDAKTAMLLESKRELAPVSEDKLRFANAENVDSQCAHERRAYIHEGAGVEPLDSCDLTIIGQHQSTVQSQYPITFDYRGHISLNTVGPSADTRVSSDRCGDQTEAAAKEDKGYLRGQGEYSGHSDRGCYPDDNAQRASSDLYPPDHQAPPSSWDVYTPAHQKYHEALMESQSLQCRSTSPRNRIC